MISQKTLLEAIMDNIKVMTEMAKAINGLMPVLPANSFPWRPSIIPTHKVIALNQMIKMHNLIYVDYYTPMVNDEQGLISTLGYDTVHPNKAGYTYGRSFIKIHSMNIKQAHWENLCIYLKMPLSLM